MVGRVQQRLPSPIGRLPSAGRHAGPTSRTPLPDRRLLVWRAGVSELQPARGRQSCRWPASRGVPGCLLSAAQGLICTYLAPAAIHDSTPLTRRRRSTYAPGFRAEFRRVPRPLPLRCTEALRGTKIRRCRFLPGQTIPVCVISPAGLQGELYFRISCQAPTEPLDYTPTIFARLATPP
ncbi:hypothetical protein NDU88_001831 [Pleurodeles waltl]|uniref:Uncharacterized protein n=1 Tax=Pleurodeles waltl TaxID=8319 RepID=A0AAV7Q4U5_PLEWA|nr:hypothetical protein NDU88_001831 [Pleurodeles waltl]